MGQNAPIPIFQLTFGLDSVGVLTHLRRLSPLRRNKPKKQILETTLAPNGR
jgi:hypothetical protein